MKPSLLLLLTLGLALLVALASADNDHNGNSNSLNGTVETILQPANAANLLLAKSVEDTFKNYAIALNRLVEFALPADCNGAGVNIPALNASAIALITQFFSTRIKSYVVFEQTAASGPLVPVSNLTVGPDTGYPTTESLFKFLQLYYLGFTAGFFSRPFWWVTWNIVVTQINLADSNFYGATTAYVTANDMNQGYFCGVVGQGVPGGQRGWRVQESEYHQVFALESIGSGQVAWKFVQFQETNKNQVNAPNNALPVQEFPPN